MKRLMCAVGLHGWSDWWLAYDGRLHRVCVRPWCRGRTAQARSDASEQRLSEDCRCVTRVNANGALVVIADSECDRHRPAILDVQS